jgi:predicted DNA-binding ribbon-helix-helix protein
MKSSNVRHAIAVSGRKTSVSLEDAFWNGFKEIAAARDMTLAELAGIIYADGQHTNLSSAIRLYVLGAYRDRLDFEKRRAREDMVGAALVL